MIPFQIAFRNSPGQPNVSAHIEERIQGLEQYYDRIDFCRVTVSAPHHPNRPGTTFHVNILLSIPGEDIVINREPEKNPEHKDIALAVRDAFDAAERHLEDRVRRNRALNRRARHHSLGTTLARRSS